MLTRRSLAAALAIATPLACMIERRSPDEPIGAVETLWSPASPGSGEPNLHVANDGSVLMSWLEPQPDSAIALRFAILRGGIWSPPRTIASSHTFFANWADFPSVIQLENGDLIAHWLDRSGSQRYAYDALIARSTDGGVTWSDGERLHTDRAPVEHGFVSLWPTGGGGAGAVWLDARSTETGVRGSMTLMHRELSAEGMSVERAIDTRVCDCCQTSVAVTSRGPVVVYRDRSPDEVRDIAIARLTSAGWSDPRLVHADGWHIEACPVNGPSVSARGERVAVAWFTAARDTAVLVAFSDDAGATFSSPVRADEGAPAGRVAIVIDDGGGAVVSWIERTGAESAEVLARWIGRDGSRANPVSVAASSAARASGFPRMVRSGDELFFAWTAPGSPSAVRVARARIGGGE